MDLQKFRELLYKQRGMTVEQCIEHLENIEYPETYEGAMIEAAINLTLTVLRDEEIKPETYEMTKYDLKFNDIYESQIDFAEMIFESLLFNKIVIAKAPMQFGKTGTLFYLVNFLLRSLLAENENVVFMTAMSDTALLIQNKANLQNRDISVNDCELKLPSKIVVMKMNPDFRNNAENYIQDYGIKYVIFDECDYGSGNKSLFNKTFFDRLKKAELDVRLVLISATPYCALHAVATGELDAGVVEANVPDNYFGVQKMLNGEVELVDMKDGYGDGSEIPYTLLSRGEQKSFNLSPMFIEDLEKFKSEDGGGLAIVRAKNTREAHLIEALTVSHFRDEFETYSDTSDEEDEEFNAISVGVGSMPIGEVLGNNNLFLRNKVISNNKKVLLIVVNALAAGKDLGTALKERVRLLVETRKNAIANGSQGLVGRVCGYHENRNIKIVASKDVLENYAKLDADWTVMQDQSFVNECIDLKLNFSTQLKKGKKAKEKKFYPSKLMGKFTFDDIRNKSPRLMGVLADVPSFANDHEMMSSFELLKSVVLENKKAPNGIEVGTQRSTKFTEGYKHTWDEIKEQCENGEFDFTRHISRFQSSKKAGLDADRLKRVIIVDEGYRWDNENPEVFYIYDRTTAEPELDKTDGEMRNSSSYTK